MKIKIDKGFLKYWAEAEEECRIFRCDFEMKFNDDPEDRFNGYLGCRVPRVDHWVKPEVWYQTTGREWIREWIYIREGRYTYRYRVNSNVKGLLQDYGVFKE